MTYEACVKEFCRKSVTRSLLDGLYYCGRCNGRSRTCYRALLVVMEVMDRSDKNFVVMFDEVARRTFGMSGAEVYALEGRYGESAARDKVAEGFVGREHMFVVYAPNLTRWILSCATPL